MPGVSGKTVIIAVLVLRHYSPR